MDARLAVWLHLLARFLPPAGASMDSCYGQETAAPGRCLPKFENVAFNRSVLVSNRCGSAPEEFCMQMGSAARSCHLCDASVPGFGHGAALLTDFHRNEEPTWWQSQSMYFGIQHPNSVNLTLRLGKRSSVLALTACRTRRCRLKSISTLLLTKRAAAAAHARYLDASGACLLVANELDIRGPASRQDRICRPRWAL